jgi:hypothetical protein
VPDPAASPDAVVRLLLPLLVALHGLLTQAGMAAPVVQLAVSFAYLGLYVALIAALVRFRHRAADPRVALLMAGLAMVLAAWVAWHPGSGHETALARGDHVLLAGLGGAALRHLSAAARLRVLVAASLAIVARLVGPASVAIVLAGMAGGMAAQRLSAGARAGHAALAQAVVLVATLAACRVAWVYDHAIGSGAVGLFVFMLLRHVSWVVDVRRGAGGTPLDYWCYQLFYPCCYGATERYADFWARNPDPGGLVDDGQLFRAAVRGAVYLQIFVLVPGTTDIASLVAIPGSLGFAGAYLMLFVRSALFLMSIWATLQAMALGLGMRIHPNFAGILAAKTPSQFWESWRGTMTRWLIEYVYIPLGGNRAHQTRNVFVVFAVSTAWHCLGIPFLRISPRPADFLPVLTWGFVNAIVLATVLAWRRHGPRPSPATPSLVREGASRLGTWVFGGVTVTFLGFYGDLAPRFPEFLLRFVGVR